MMTRFLIAVLVGYVAEVAAELAAFTDASIPLEISDNINAIDMPKVISLFFIVRRIDNSLFSALA
jgi:hypothetical protein